MAKKSRNTPRVASATARVSAALASITNRVSTNRPASSKSSAAPIAVIAARASPPNEPVDSQSVVPSSTLPAPSKARRSLRLPSLKAVSTQIQSIAKFATVHRTIGLVSARSTSAAASANKNDGPVEDIDPARKKPTSGPTSQPSEVPLATEPRESLSLEYLAVPGPSGLQHRAHETESRSDTRVSAIRKGISHAQPTSVQCAPTQRINPYLPLQPLTIDFTDTSSITDPTKFQTTSFCARRASDESSLLRERKATKHFEKPVSSPKRVVAVRPLHSRQVLQATESTSHDHYSVAQDVGATYDNYTRTVPPPNVVVGSELGSRKPSARMAREVSRKTAGTLRQTVDCSVQSPRMSTGSLRGPGENALKLATSRLASADSLVSTEPRQDKRTSKKLLTILRKVSPRRLLHPAQVMSAESIVIPRPSRLQYNVKPLKADDALFGPTVRDLKHKLESANTFLAESSVVHEESFFQPNVKSRSSTGSLTPAAYSGLQHRNEQASQASHGPLAPPSHVSVKHTKRTSSWTTLAASHLRRPAQTKKVSTRSLDTLGRGDHRKTSFFKKGAPTDSLITRDTRNICGGPESIKLTSATSLNMPVSLLLRRGVQRTRSLPSCVTRDAFATGSGVTLYYERLSSGAETHQHSSIHEGDECESSVPTDEESESSTEDKDCGVPAQKPRRRMHSHRSDSDVAHDNLKTESASQATCEQTRSGNAMSRFLASGRAGNRLLGRGQSGINRKASFRASGRARTAPASVIRDFSTRLHRACPLQYTKKNTASKHLRSLQRRLIKTNLEWPRDVALTALCRHGGNETCWLLELQEDLNELLDPHDFELGETMHGVYALRQVGGLFVPRPRAAREANLLEATTLLVWILETHRCIDRLHLNVSSLCDPEYQRQMFGLISLSGNYSVVRIGLFAPAYLNVEAEAMVPRATHERLFNALRSMTALRELWLFGICFDTDIGDDRNFGALLEEAASMRRLDLVDCDVPPNVFAALVNAIARHNSIRRVRLALTNTAELDTCAGSLIDLLHGQDTLKFLYIRLAHDLADFCAAVGGNQRLTELEITNRPSWKTVQALTSSLSRNYKLRCLTISLDFSSCQSHTNVVEAFVRALDNGALEVLKLPHSRFTASVIRVFGEALAANTTMRKLDLSKAHITCDEGLALVQLVVSKNTTMGEMKLGALCKSLLRKGPDGRLRPMNQLDVLRCIVDNTCNVATVRTELLYEPRLGNEGNVWISKDYFPEEARDLMELVRKGVTFRRLKLNFRRQFAREDRRAYAELMSFLVSYRATETIDSFSLKTSTPMEDHAVIGMAGIFITASALTHVTIEFRYGVEETTCVLLLDVLAENCTISSLKIVGWWLGGRVPAYFERMCFRKRGLRRLKIHMHQMDDDFMRQLYRILNGSYSLNEFKLTYGPSSVEIDVPEVRVLLRRNQRLLYKALSLIKEVGRASGSVDLDHMLDCESTLGFGASDGYDWFEDFIAEETGWPEDNIEEVLRHIRPLASKKALCFTSGRWAETAAPASVPNRQGFCDLNSYIEERLGVRQRASEVAVAESPVELPDETDYSAWVRRALDERRRASERELKRFQERCEKDLSEKWKQKDTKGGKKKGKPATNSH